MSIDNPVRLAGSVVSFATGVVCLCWSALWLESPSAPGVFGLDAVLSPLTDFVWVPGIALFFLATGVSLPLHRYVPRSRALRGVTLLTGGVLLGINTIWVLFPVVPPYSSGLSAVYNAPLTTTALLLLGVGTTGWLVKEP